jgi:hypothetical protein
MSVSAISGASSAPSTKFDPAELAVAATAKALRVQRQQADAMISLIQQATPSGDVGRHISVRV